MAEKARKQTPFRMEPSLFFFTLCLCAAGCGNCNGSATDLGGEVDRSHGKVPTIEVPFVEKAHLQIDGNLQESVWKKAAGTGPFVHPRSGREQPSNPAQASAKVFWDASNLYVGFEVKDPSPTSPFQRTAQDPHIWSKASGIEIMVQPGDFGDNRTYFEIQVDIKGAVWDTRFDAYNRPIVKSYGRTLYGHQHWSASVQRHASIHKNTYTMEVAIPWKAFAPALKTRKGLHLPPHPKETWRLNFYAFRDGQRKASAWSPLLGKGNFHRASRFGRVVFQKK